MTNDLDKSYLGTGWSFPPEFDKGLYMVKMVSEEEDIKQSLQILLSTTPGERVMMPLFGCNLKKVIFEPLTTSLKTYIKELITTSILHFEPRINLNDIFIEEQDDRGGVILIYLEYTIRTTNSRTNMVYPFYKEEGTNIEDRALYTSALMANGRTV